jgi:hypothetical protein
MTRFLATLGLVLALSPAACSVDLDVVLFNTTGRAIAVVVGERRIELAPLESVSFKAGPFLSGKVLVLDGGSEFQYVLDPSGHVPSAYYRSAGWAADIWVQLDPELRVHLIPASVSEPGTPFPEQPPGFPLAPVSRHARRLTSGCS